MDLDKFDKDLLCKTMISILRSFYDSASISEYADLIFGILVTQVSEISKLNLQARLAIHAIVSSQKELYLGAVKYGTGQINSFSTTTAQLSEVGTFLDEIISNLKVALYEVETALSLPYGSLDAFEANETEVESGIAIKEDSDPLYLNYFTLRQLALNNSSILKSFTDLKISMENSSESIKQSTVVKDDMVMNMIADGMQASLDYLNTLYALSGGAGMASLAYEIYGFTTREQVETFLSRPYNEIKADIIAEVF